MDNEIIFSEPKYWIKLIAKYLKIKGKVAISKKLLLNLNIFILGLNSETIKISKAIENTI